MMEQASVRRLRVPPRLSTARVLLMGALLLAVGTAGFYFLPGMIDEGATGSRTVNAFYCSAITLTTVGYGDICPRKTNTIGKAFLIVFSLGSLGFFCGPVLDAAASVWQQYVPGGTATLASLMIGVGVALFTSLEGMDQIEAIYTSIVTGTTIGYGDYTPKSDLGKVLVACYAIVIVNVVAVLLQPGRRYLESLCQVHEKPVPAKTS